MTTARTVTTASERADIAARLLKTFRPYPDGFGLSRSFNDCFTQGDGPDVVDILVGRARQDPELRAAIRQHASHHPSGWLAALESDVEFAEVHFAFMAED